MSDTYALVNPTAGGARAGGLWAAWRERALALAPLHELTAPDREAARRAVAHALAAGCRRLLVWGGDGTMHVVVGEVLRAGAGDRVTLGLVAAGTGCDLARALDIPRDVGAALRRALLGPPRPLDAGRCETAGTTFFFANIASAGLSGMVDERVNAMANRGATAFLRATLEALVAFRPLQVRVRADGEPLYEGPMALLAVANGTSFGKGMRVAPRARLDDGLFDVVLVGRVGRPGLIARLPALYLGRHLGARPVTCVRARCVELEPGEDLPPFDADGETYPGGRATFTLLPAALRVAGA